MTNTKRASCYLAIYVLPYQLSVHSKKYLLIGSKRGCFFNPTKPLSSCPAFLIKLLRKKA
jgi:hypothetical protein